jgi:signal transduction histidine kinase
VPAPPGEARSDLFELGAASDSERERHLQLAVTKQLVLRHGGSLTVDRGFHGTRVVVAFPAAEAEGAGA